MDVDARMLDEGPGRARKALRKPPERTPAGFPLIYCGEPAPLANPEGYLDRAWRVVRYAVIPRPERSEFGPMLVYHRTVARFPADGRDACERWARERGV